jgi:hypothetical protein
MKPISLSSTNFPNESSSPESNWTPPFDSNKDWSIATSGQADDAGIRLLWSVFFNDYIGVQKEDWDSTIPNYNSITNKDFYTSLFDSTLSKWFDKLQSKSLLPADYRTLPGESVDPNRNNLPYTTLVGPRPPTSLVVSDHSTFSYADWLMNFTGPSKTISKTWYKYEPNDLASKWKYYLTETNVETRTQSSLMWVFAKLLEMLQKMQKNLVGQSQRSISLSEAQKGVTEAMHTKSKEYSIPTSANDIYRQSKNQEISRELQVLQSKGGVAQGRVSMQSTYTQQSQEAIQAQNSLMASMIQQLETVLSNLFK